MKFHHKTNKKSHYLFLIEITYCQILIIFKAILPFKPYDDKTSETVL